MFLKKPVIVRQVPLQDGEPGLIGNVIAPLLLGRHLGYSSLGVTNNMTHLANLSWGILVTWPNHRNWHLSINKNGSTFRALRIFKMRSYF